MKEGAAAVHSTTTTEESGSEERFRGSGLLRGRLLLFVTMATLAACQSLDIAPAVVALAFAGGAGVSRGGL